MAFFDPHNLKQSNSNIWNSYLFNEINRITKDDLYETDSLEATQAKEPIVHLTQKNAPRFTVRDLMHRLLNMDLDSTIEIGDKEIVGANEFKLTTKVVKLTTRDKYTKSIGISSTTPIEDFNVLSTNLHHRIRESLFMQQETDELSKARKDITDVEKKSWEDLLED